MSGGDLIPFVAATLRDKVVEETAEEIKQLREENERQRGEIERLSIQAPPIMELIHTESGMVFMSGQFERESCLDVDVSACLIERHEDVPFTFSQLLQCSLCVSGETWYPLNNPVPQIDYVELYGPNQENNFRVKIYFEGEFGGLVDVNAFTTIAADARAGLLTFIGRPGSEEEYLSDLTVDFNQFINAYGHLSIGDALVSVPAVDMIMRGPHNE